MNLIVQIPDDVGHRLSAAGRRSVTARARSAGAQKNTGAVILRSASFAACLASVRAMHAMVFEGVHDVFEPYSLDDLERARRDLLRLGLQGGFRKPSHVSSLPGSSRRPRILMIHSRNNRGGRDKPGHDGGRPAKRF